MTPIDAQLPPLPALGGGLASDAAAAPAGGETQALAQVFDGLLQKLLTPPATLSAPAALTAAETPVAAMSKDASQTIMDPVTPGETPIQALAPINGSPLTARPALALSISASLLALTPGPVAVSTPPPPENAASETTAGLNAAPAPTIACGAHDPAALAVMPATAPTSQAIPDAQVSAAPDLPGVTREQSPHAASEHAPVTNVQTREAAAPDETAGDIRPEKFAEKPAEKSVEKRAVQGDAPASQPSDPVSDGALPVVGNESPAPAPEKTPPATPNPPAHPAIVSTPQASVPVIAPIASPVTPAAFATQTAGPSPESASVGSPRSSRAPSSTPETSIRETSIPDVPPGLDRAAAARLQSLASPLPPGIAIAQQVIAQTHASQTSAVTNAFAAAQADAPVLTGDLSLSGPASDSLQATAESAPTPWQSSPSKSVASDSGMMAPSAPGAERLTPPQQPTQALSPALTAQRATAQVQQIQDQTLAKTPPPELGLALKETGTPASAPDANAARVSSSAPEQAAPAPVVSVNVSKAPPSSYASLSTSAHSQETLSSSEKSAHKAFEGLSGDAARASSLDVSSREVSGPESTPPSLSPAPSLSVAASGSSVHAASGAVTIESAGSTHASAAAQAAPHLKDAMASGRKEVILQLKPESLGEVRAQLSASGRHGVTVRLETVTEQAREALLQDVDALRRSIESQGVRVDRIQVACHSRAVSASADGQGARFDFGQSGQSGQWTSQGQSAQSSLSDGSGGAHGGRRDEAFSAAWQQQSQQQGHGGSRQHDARAFHGNARPDAPSRSEATHAAERFLGDGRRDADPLAATRVSGRVSVLA